MVGMNQASNVQNGSVIDLGFGAVRCSQLCRIWVVREFGSPNVRDAANWRWALVQTPACGRHIELSKGPSVLNSKKGQKSS
jgi:hypothetical protein